MLLIPRAFNALRSIPPQAPKALKMKSADNTLSSMLKRYSSTAPSPRRSRSYLVPLALSGTFAAGSYYYFKLRSVPSYTRQQVAEHRNGVWMTYRGGVYDLTEYAQQEHPAGEEIIVAAAGGDLDSYWEDYKFHRSPKIVELLKPMRIGNLKADGEVSPRRCKKPKVIPRVDAKDYRLELVVDGVTAKKLTLEDVKRYPKHSIVNAIPCKSSEKQPAAVVKPTWTGARLSDVLQDLDVKSEGYSHMEFECLDDGKSGVMAIPNDMADVILAYEMDGAELSVEHGYPIRVIALQLPGRRNVKWLGKIVFSKKADESKEA